MTLAKIEHLALCNRCLKVKAYSSEREVAHACDYGSADSICQCGGKRCCCSHCQQVIRFLDSGLFKEAEAEIQHIIKGEVIACWSREQVPKSLPIRAHARAQPFYTAVGVAQLAGKKGDRHEQHSRKSQSQ